MNDPTLIMSLAGTGVFIQTAIFKKITDQAQIRMLKRETDKLMSKMKSARNSGDIELMTKHTNKINELNMKKMNLTFKPNMLSSLPLMGLFIWMKGRFSELVMNLPFPIPYPQLSLANPIGFKTQLGWLGWYFLCAMVAGYVARKAMEVEI